MAVFEIIEGQPGNGKSLYTARTVRHLVHRNKKWHEKTGVIRLVYSNLKFSEEFENSTRVRVASVAENGDVTYDLVPILRYWYSVDEVAKLHDCDLIWDEIATEMDARTFTTLSDSVKRFLSQYDKRGVEIYANTQDYSMVDLRARMFVTRVATLTKLLGNRRPSPTRPPIKRIWGFILIRDLSDWKATDPSKKTYSILPSFFMINREDVEIYDTRQSIETTQLPIKYVRPQVFEAVDTGKQWTKYV